MTPAAHLPADAYEHDQARLVQAFQDIGRTMLRTTDLDALLDVAIRSIVDIAGLRSLMIALVDHDAGKVTVVRQVFRVSPDWELVPIEEARVEATHVVVELDDVGVASEVARTGERIVIDGWDDRFEPRDGILAVTEKASYADKVSYFLPVLDGDRTVAVLATGSTTAQKAETLRNIEAMSPLLAQLAVALQHAKLYADLRETARSVGRLNRVLSVSQEIGREVLAARTPEERVEKMMMSVGRADLFRNLSFSVVDHVAGSVRLMRTMWREAGGDFHLSEPGSDTAAVIPLSSGNILAEVCRTGKPATVVGWDDRFMCGEPESALLDPANYDDKVSYFTPILHGSQVVAVLATTSTHAERQTIESRLEAMEPLFNLVAVAIDHSKLVEHLSGETRRLDTLAEARQRENLALLEINRHVQEMSSLSDLENVVRGISGTLHDLGFDVASMTIRRVVDAETGVTDAYHLRPGGRYRRRRRVRPGVVERWRSGSIEYVPDRFAQPGFSTDHSDRRPNLMRSILTVPFQQGTITLRSSGRDAFSEADRDLILRVGNVLSVGISRVGDLEEIERSRTYETALLGISQVCQKIEAEDGVPSLITGSVDILDKAGVPCDGFRLERLIDRETHTFHVWRWSTQSKCALFVHNSRDLFERLADFETVVRPDVAADLAGLGEGYQKRAWERYKVDVRSTVDIPFSKGVFGLVSRLPHAYSSEQVRFLERVAELVSVGMTRVYDLERLEKQRIEQEALILISRTVLGMARPDDVGSVMRVFGDQLERCGVRFTVLTYSVLLRPDDASLHTYRLRHDGKFVHFFRKSEGFWHRWRTGETFYQPDDNREARGIHVRSTLHVPHVGGLLSILSTEPDAFPMATRDLIDRLSEPLSLGFARLSDLEEAQRRADEIATQEARVRGEKEFSDSLIASLREGFCLLDSGGTIVDVNRSFCAMTGFGRDELVGCGMPHPFWPPEQSRRMFVLAARADRGDMRDLEIVLMRKDGTRFPVVVSPSVTQEADNRKGAWFATVRDVTEEKELQSERAHSQRLRVIGELSAGVSHNLNNILTSILGPAQLLELKTDDPDLLNEIETIRYSATRAADLVQRLSWTTADRREELGPVNLAESIEQAVRAAEPRWRDESEAKGVTIDVDVSAKNVPPIRGSRAGMHDMLLNLIFNAVDAMPEGGRIAIRTAVADGEVVLTVTDTGIGMSETTRRRVFEPFFTTKMDVGSGLGLSTLFGTIRAWGGSVDVRSEPGAGSTFTLRFTPWQDVRQRHVARGSEVRTSARNRNGRILVVDDDPFVGRFVQRTLSDAHDVEVFQDPERALEAFRPDAYDVCIIDLGMPGLSGDALATEIRRQDSAVALVMITGWALEPDDPRQAPFDFSLKKPFESLHQVEETAEVALKLKASRSD